MSVVGAVVSVASFGFGVWKASKELDRWRTEKREVKLAEVAAEVMLTGFRFLTELEAVASPIVSTPGGFQEEVRERWTRLVEHQNRFLDAWNLAEVYLPEDSASILEAIWKKRASLYVSQWAYFESVVNKTYTSKHYADAFGQQVYEALAALRERLRSSLRSIARLEKDKPNYP